MLFDLVKKDFILAKKYLLFSLVIIVGAPIFISSKINLSSEGFISFFITVIYLEYMLFNTVSLSEDKFKGSALLCATPYTRNTLVKAKYLFILVIFICVYVLYTITAFISPIDIEMLSIFTFGISLLLTAIFFGIFVPLLYKFGYEKTKYISFIIIFICPFIVPSLIKWMRSNNISLDFTLPLPQIVQDLLPCLLAVIIGLVSMLISINIYSKKNL